jgi:DNA-binding transcriptional MocR family regulator
MHVLLRLRDDVDDDVLAGAAAAAGVGVRALSPLHLQAAPERGLLLGYGRLAESQIEEAVGALAEVIDRGGA